VARSELIVADWFVPPALADATSTPTNTSPIASTPIAGDGGSAEVKL